MTNRDDTSCNHGHGYAGLDVIVTNQPDEYDSSRPHRSVWVCKSRECVLDAMAWVLRGTGEKPWWREGTAGAFHDEIYGATA